MSIEQLEDRTLLSTTRLFDFDAPGTPTQAGYLGVQRGDLYTAAQGFGWLTAVGSFDRGAISGPQADLRRDGHDGSTPQTFRLDLSDGSYFVNATIGDASFGRDHIQVKANGVVALADVTTTAGQFFQGGFAVTVSGGALELQFSDLGGDPFWVVNGLEIRSVAEVGAITFSAGPGSVPADGTTVDMITGASSLAPGTLVTITSTLGTIQLDDSPDYTRTQVSVGAGGSLSIPIRRATGGGTPTLTAVAIDGSAEGSAADAAILSYVLPTTRLFDFDAPGTPTQAGYLGVQRGDLYTAAQGFGWLTAVGSFDRGAISGPQADLRRDGHDGSTPQTFRLDLSDGSYFVNATIGDASFGRDHIQVKANGVVALADVTTTAGQFFQGGFAVTVSGGALELQFSDLGGDPFWVVNGLEIRPVEADLELVQQVDNSSPNFNGLATFTLTLTNGGPNAATGVVVRDLIPVGLTLVSATPSNGSYDSSNGHWNVGSLSAAAGSNMATLAITARVTIAGTTLTNTAEVIASDQFDPDSTPNNGVASEDDQASTTIMVPSQLTVSSTADSGASSLRQAILDANSSSGNPHTIAFQLPAGPQTITLLTSLPMASDPLTLSLDASQTVTVVGSSATAWNNDHSQTLSGAGSLTFGGGIDGTGDLAVSAGGNLAANHIVQDSLAIGGTPGSPAMVTIAASDANGNPLYSAAASNTSSATDAMTSFPEPAPPTSGSASAVATASTLTPTTASSEPPISVAVAPSSHEPSGVALVVKSNSSDSAGLIALQSSSETGGVSGLAYQLSNESERSSSLTTTGVSGTSDTATFLERQTAVVPDKNGELLRRDAVAAAFADADVLEWATSTPAAQHSTAGVDISLLSDDLLDVIGRQWQN